MVATTAVLLATLWPFNPFPRNGAHWIVGANGLRFENPGLVVSDGPLRLPDSDAESYSLELLVRPARVSWSYTILALYVPTRPRQLLVRQWTDGLLVTHDATVERDKTRTIKFDVDHAFNRGRLVLVTICSGPNGTVVYLDGQPAGTFPGFRISRGELAGEIVLGTSPVTYHPWVGELHGLAIYSKQLTPAEALRHYQDWTDPGAPPDLDNALARYTFAQGPAPDVRNQVTSGPNLEIPASFSVPHKALLRSALTEFSADHRYALDVGINIAGFVPLGLIVCAALSWTRTRRRATLTTIALCGMLSFVIEVLQYYIPRRGSGTTDIITNTLGATLGAMLMQVGAIHRALERMKLVRSVRDSF